MEKAEKVVPLSVNATLSNLFDVFAAPAQAFRNLEGRAGALLPLVLLLAAWIAVWNWYYGAVDYPWLINHLIDVQTYGVDQEKRDGISTALAHMKPGALIVISSATVIAVTLILTTVMSAYLLVVSAFYNDKYRYKDWFAFLLWASLPTLVSIVAMVANFLLSADRRIAPESLNPLSLNELFFHVGLGNSLKKILDSLDLPAIWSWVVMIIGYREWTGRSLPTSAAIILSPWAVVYALWALLSVI